MKGGKKRKNFRKKRGPQKKREKKRKHTHAQLGRCKWTGDKGSICGEREPSCKRLGKQEGKPTLEL